MSKLTVNKMRCILFIIMCLIPTLTANGSVNYCGSKMCSHTNEHTLCQYPAGPSPACMGHMEARLSTDEKTRIIVRLNRRRQEVALGLGTLHSAGDMLRLRWVEELAREAQRWANQCRPPGKPEEHDVCRDLYSITVGQCVASVVGEAPGLRPETMVDIWYMQSMHFKGNVTLYITPEEENNYYGDFGQMIWSRTFMVGCGRSRFMTEWRGRVRSVERLVCNFAPRGPVARRALWRPAPPAAACPPRATPDTGLPGLCTYQMEMEETSVENDLMSLEDQLLLDTVLDIEKNKSLDYVGSLDEIYLTRLAVANMEKSDSVTSSYNPVQKRDLLERSGANNSSYLKIELNFSAYNTSIFSLNTPKKKASLVGRPKSYKVEDLNDSNFDQDTENYYKIQTTTTTDKEIYGYYEYNEIEDKKSTTLSTAKVFEYSNIETTQRLNESMDLNGSDISTIIISSRSNTQDFISSGDSTVTRDLYILNDSSIDDNVIDDYLTDPETARQLQEALERMERNLAATLAPTPGKVRREVPRQSNNNYRTRPDLSGEIERNKTIDRGPMLSMMLKYMPYFKNYEKNFLGDSSSDNAKNISPFVLMICIILVNYFQYVSIYDVFSFYFL